MADIVTDADGVHGLRIESGTWTPTLAGNTTPGSNTYSVQSGTYYKVGKMVVLQFAITLSAKDAAMVGALKINGLPFVPSAITFGATFARIASLALGGTYSQYSGFCSVSSSAIFIAQMGGSAGTWNNIDAVAASNTTEITGSLTYFTA
jgi:hypothetical protein